MLMKRTLAALIVSILMTSNAIADQIPNGCGPKGYGWAVPDSTLITQCKFTKACDIHDACYSRCAEGGDLHGLATCSNEPERQARKKQCDKDFFEDISYFNGDRAICRLYGKLYASAVSTGGNGFFQGYERPELFFQDISTKPGEIDRLLNQLDEQILTPPAAKQEPLIILKMGDRFNLGVVTNQTEMMEQLSKGTKELTPAFKLQQKE